MEMILVLAINNCQLIVYIYPIGGVFSISAEGQVQAGHADLRKRTRPDFTPCDRMRIGPASGGNQLAGLQWTKLRLLLQLLMQVPYRMQRTVEFISAETSCT